MTDPPEPDADEEVANATSADYLPRVYAELRRLAQIRVSSEGAGQSVTATDLVHEAYFRLAKGDDDRIWNDKKHFFAVAAVETEMCTLCTICL